MRVTPARGTTALTALAGPAGGGAPELPRAGESILGAMGTTVAGVAGRRFYLIGMMLGGGQLCTYSEGCRPAYRCSREC